MKKLFTFLILNSAFFISFSQATFQKAYFLGGGFSGCQTTDGGFVTGVGDWTAADSGNAGLMKTDSMGNLLWQKLTV